VTWLERAAMQRGPPSQATPNGRVSLPEAGVASDFATMTLGHAGALYRTAYHLAGNADEAEDLTQETYLRAYRGFAGFRGGDVRAWLFTILRHVFLDECRRRHRMPPIETVDDDAHRFIANRVGPWAPSAETEALRRLPSDTVERAFAALPPDWRLVVLLADIEELSYREIASIMEIPLGTVMSRLHRARRRLQEQLLATRQPDRKPHERSA
jgi:RNA polymerase sigma-70 factor (ECF subfamily)